MTEEEIGPETINSLADGAMAAFAMLAGMQLDIFDALGEGPRSADQIAESIGSDPDKTSLLLYALVVAGLMTEKDGLFNNTPETAKFLVTSSPTNIVGRQHSFNRAWGNALLRTAESVKSGRPQAETDFGSMSQDELEDFLRGLHHTSLAIGRSLLDNFDFSSCQSLLDVGAGTGGATLILAEANPHIKATVQDFPAVTAIAEKYIGESGLSDRVDVLPGNATVDSLQGPHDVAIMANLIQVLNREQAQKVLQNVGRAVSAGGYAYIIGRFIDDARTTPAGAALFNLNFLNIYDGGQAYTHSEYRNWLDAAGFEDFKITAIPGENGIISARKR